YTASGNWDLTVLWLWALSVLYFASSVFYIKLRVLRLNPRRKERQQQVWQYSASYHVFLLTALVSLAITGQLKIFALIAFLPVLIRAFWSLNQTSTQLNLKKAGMLEMVYSIIFLIFVTLNFRLGQ
ncbi:MAG TPA: hypothetical protein VEF04_19200, partial [Blastocatellia bacterium]|nr:hypothetical protein [Blastocatellia bacterium]